jgi:hypothetical protein
MGGRFECDLYDIAQYQVTIVSTILFLLAFSITDFSLAKIRLLAKIHSVAVKNRSFIRTCIN